MASVHKRGTTKGHTRYVVSYRTVDGKQRRKSFTTPAEAHDFAHQQAMATEQERNWATLCTLISHAQLPISWDQRERIQAILTEGKA